MARVLAVGEPLVEVMRTERDLPLDRPGGLAGPFPSGAPAIFASAAARLGLATGFAGMVGADAFGSCVLQRLRSDGVDLSLTRTSPDRPTAVAFVAYDSRGGRSFVFTLRGSAAAQLETGDLPPAQLRRVDLLHLTGSTLGISRSAREACYRAARECRAAGARISFDPNLRAELLAGEAVEEVMRPLVEICTVLLPSAAEASLLTGEADEEAACRALVRRGVEIVALKRGRRGSAVFTREGALEVPSIEVEEVDPTGAGDCYDAAFVAGLLEGWDLPRIARFANVAAALSVTQRGPMEGLPDLEGVLRAL